MDNIEFWFSNKHLNTLNINTFLQKMGYCRRWNTPKEYICTVSYFIYMHAISDIPTDMSVCTVLDNTSSINML